MDRKQGQDAEAVTGTSGVLQFTAFDFLKKNFPRPLVSALPTPPARLRPNASQVLSSAFDEPDRRMFQRGRYALQQAMHLAGLARGETILLPAYHCRTMLDPALSMGASILLYPLTDRLAPDFDALVPMLRDRQPKAMLLPHYFGFPQDLDAAESFCKQRDICLIEDCAHAFFGRWQGRRLGQVGDYAVASVPKFFAYGEGGILIGDRIGRETQTPALMATTKSLARYAKHSLEQKLSTNRKKLEVAGVVEVADKVENAGENCHDVDIVYETSEPSAAYDASLALASDSFLAKQIVRFTDRGHLVEARRERYRQWLDAVVDTPGCEPLFGDLPDDVVPYMFPLLVHDPQSVFDTLKRRRLPMFRWDELAASVCTVSAHYRLALFQFPCHQSLDDAEMEWMIETARNTLANRR